MNNQPTESNNTPIPEGAFYVDDDGLLHEIVSIKGKDGEIEVMKTMAQAFQAVANHLLVNVEIATGKRQLPVEST